MLLVGGGLILWMQCPGRFKQNGPFFHVKSVGVAYSH